MKSPRGFTIIEVIATMGLLLFGVVAALSAVTYSVRASTAATNRLAATFLAAEGLEIIHNMRDSNWANGEAWDTGFAPDQTYEVFSEAPFVRATQDEPLLFDEASGVYGYDTGTATSFRRAITISSGASDELTVVSRVEWGTEGQSVVLTTKLYDWRP